MASTTTLAPLSIRLAPVKRMELAQKLMDLVGAALLLRHDEAHKLARLSMDRFYGSRTDRVLLAGLGTLTAFVKDRAESGIVLPETHPCYVAAPEDVEIIRPWSLRGGE